MTTKGSASGNTSGGFLFVGYAGTQITFTAHPSGGLKSDYGYWWLDADSPSLLDSSCNSTNIIMKQINPILGFLDFIPKAFGRAPPWDVGGVCYSSALLRSVPQGSSSPSQGVVVYVGSNFSPPYYDTSLEDATAFCDPVTVTPPSVSFNPVNRVSWGGNLGVTVSVSGDANNLSTLKVCSVTGTSSCDPSSSSPVSKPYTLTLSADGANFVCAQLCDSLGNVTPTPTSGNGGCTGPFLVDKTAPSISATASSSACNTVRFTTTASDSGSGLSSTAYSFDGGATNWQANNYKDFSGTSYTLAAGQIKARDNVGNIATVPAPVSGTSTSCEIAPSITALNSPPDNTWTNSRQFCANVSGTSGHQIRAEFYTGYLWNPANNFVTTSGTSCWPATSDLNVSWYARAYDSTNGLYSGNSATWTAKIDAMAPTPGSNLSCSPPYANSAINITWTPGTDSGSGIATQYLDRYGPSGSGYPPIEWQYNDGTTNSAQVNSGTTYFGYNGGYNWVLTTRDNLGNYSTSNITSNTCMWDTAAPTVNISNVCDLLDVSYPGRNYTCSAGVATANAPKVKVDNTAMSSIASTAGPSGLDRVTVRVTNNRLGTLLDTTTISVNSSLSPTSLGLQATGVNNNSSTGCGTGCGDYTVTITPYSKSGVTGTPKVLPFKIENQAPVITSQ